MSSTVCRNLRLFHDRLALYLAAYLSKHDTYLVIITCQRQRHHGLLKGCVPRAVALVGKVTLRVVLPIITEYKSADLTSRHVRITQPHLEMA